jgi:protein required for attachment to host cells
MSGYTVFVADTRHATVFELSQPGAAPRALETLENSFTGPHDRDLGADAPGRMAMRSGRLGGGAGTRRTSLQARRSHKQHAVEQFARQLAERITMAARENNGRGLVLVAAPRFLAEVRSHLPKSTQQHIVREVPRDLVGLPSLALQHRLSEALQPMRD